MRCKRWFSWSDSRSGKGCLMFVDLAVSESAGAFEASQALEALAKLLVLNFYFWHGLMLLTWFLYHFFLIFPYIKVSRTINGSWFQAKISFLCCPVSDSCSPQDYCICANAICASFWYWLRTYLLQALPQALSRTLATIIICLTHSRNTVIIPRLHRSTLGAQRKSDDVDRYYAACAWYWINILRNLD